MNDIKIKMDKSSINQVCNNLKNSINIVTSAGLAAINNQAEKIYNKANDTCPTASGTLKSTLYKESEIAGDNIQAIVGHGGTYDKTNPVTGENADSYAVEVHESYKITSANRANGATWKWLEKAFNNQSKNFEEEISSYLLSILGG